MEALAEIVLAIVKIVILKQIVLNVRMDLKEMLLTFQAKRLLAVNKFAEIVEDLNNNVMMVTQKMEMDVVQIVKLNQDGLVLEVLL